METNGEFFFVPLRLGNVVPDIFSRVPMRTAVLPIKYENSFAQQEYLSPNPYPLFFAPFYLYAFTCMRIN